MSAAELLPHIKDILSEAYHNAITPRIVRSKLEEKLSLKDGELEPQKKIIKGFIDQVMEELSEENKDDDKPSQTKKRKASDQADGESTTIEKAPKTFTCRTSNGEEAPRDLKKTQSTMFRRASDFIKAAPTIKIDVCGNTLTADAREFSSGGRGWYTGGKVPIVIGNKVVWCQVGLNITIPGSNAWK